MRLLIHLIPFLSLFAALYSSLFALTTWRRRKKIQHLLTWCLSSLEGNDEVVLSWSFCGLANDKVCHVCFVCCVGGNLKHCGKCLQSYHLQCLDKPHKEKKHIEVSGTRQIPIKTIPTSLDEVPSQRDAYGNKSSGKKAGSSSNANAGALVDDNNVGGRLASQLVMNSAVITADFVRQKSSAAAAAFERKSSYECDGSSPRLNTSNLEDTDSFSRNKLDKLGGDSACVKQVDHPIDYFLPKE
ncbi:unnamed protein product [Prunus brigantina]